MRTQARFFVDIYLVDSFLASSRLIDLSLFAHHKTQWIKCALACILLCKRNDQYQEY